MVTNYDGEAIQIPPNLPMLPVRDIVVFPFMILPLFIGRDSSIKAVEEALSSSDRLIFLASQKDYAEEKPSPESVFNVGTVAMIMRIRKLADGRIKILVQGLSKARVNNYVSTDPFYTVNISVIEDKEFEVTTKTEAVMRNIKENLERLIGMGKFIAPDILMVLQDINDPGRLADLVASNLGLEVKEAQALLEMSDPIERIQKVDEILMKEIEVVEMQLRLKNQQKPDASKQQKEHFLKEQIKAIKGELGDTQDPRAEEVSDLREKLESLNLPEEVGKEAFKQLARFEKMHPDSSEASIIRTYLDWIVELPWSVSSEDNLDIKAAKQILDTDHCDLDKVKDRILEFLAVRKLRNKLKGPILCFSGPPGVGKTSLGKSIARSLGRQYVRISLGGVKDEAEVRGHRRTYVGAMPGRIIQGLKQAKTNNPVFVLDEIDKLAADFRGDPSAALLEVLDPEQNNSFRDHYLNLAFDLSNVMFLCTANVVENIPQALRDRMEIIHIPGYTQEEKIKIARQFIISKQLEENGITPDNLEFSDEGLNTIVANYTREAGLRNMERLIGTVCRKSAKQVAEGDPKKVVVNKDKVIEWLGPLAYDKDTAFTEDQVAVSTGLAWTAGGGEVLYIESSLSPYGKGGLTLTGQLGDVMKESAATALAHIRSRADEFGIDPRKFTDYDIHIHLPAGAVPKDGPSAGITLATCLVSLLTGTPVRHDVAMTGEITLIGKVLPIGGLKDKSLAALRLGIKNIIIPDKNVKDLEDIPKEYRERINFIPVTSFEEVLVHALRYSFEGKVSKKNLKKALKSKRKSVDEAAA